MNKADRKATVPLWLLGLPVAVWGVHFMVVYVVAAIYCAKAPAFETAAGTPLTTVRWLTAAFTLVALAAYAFAAKRGYAGARKPGAATNEDPPNQDRFLGSVLLMLCTLSAAATVFVASVAFFFGDCRR